MLIDARRCILAASCSALVAGCAGDVDQTDSQCQVAIDFDPDPVVASEVPVVATARVLNAGDVALSYAWKITFQGAVSTKTGLQVSFVANVPGTYDVELAPPAPTCLGASARLNVGQPGANAQTYAIRVTTATNGSIIVPYVDDTNADTARDLVVPRAVAAKGRVLAAGVGVPSLVRITPAGRVDPIAEVATDNQGQFALLLAPQPYEVLVVPMTSGAPQRFASWTPEAGAVVPLTLTAGVDVQGQVQAGDGTPLPGATVALTVDGVPSTVATTGSDGRFTVAARAGVHVDFAVTPPSGSGLPRLVGGTDLVSLAALPAIRYSASLTSRDLVGLAVTKGAAPAGGARVSVVGKIVAAGQLAGTSVILDGHVRSAATTDAGGVLGALRVPRAALAVVLQASTGEIATRAFDTTVAPPATLDIGSPPQVTGAATIAGAPVGGALVRLEPIGALAEAGIATTSVLAGADGAFSATAAQGGVYRVAIVDPKWRALPVFVNAAAPAALGARQLAPRFLRTGVVRTEDSLVGNAVIELLCSSCVGIDRQRPIAETASTITGQFQLAVPKRAL